MKTLLCVLIFLNTDPSLAEEQSAKLHFVACTAVSFASSHAMESPLAGFAIGVITGYMKEATDTKFSREDFRMDVLGALTGSILTVRIEL